MRTNQFYIYIYDEKTKELIRKVDVKKLAKERSESYNPRAFVGISLVNGEICYDITIADNETVQSFKMAFSLETDEIVKEFATQKEWEQARQAYADKYGMPVGTLND